MAEENENNAGGTPSPEAASQGDKPAPKIQALTQFVRDLSFENILAQKGVQGDAQPDIKVQVGLDAKKRQTEHQYEIIAKFNIESKAKESGATLFLMELEYAGIFHIENIPNEQLHPFLMIECPRIMFPFIRRVVSDVTRDGGFPALNLENIDFVQLYRQEIARRAQEEKSKQPVS